MIRIKGLATVIYYVPDLTRATEWYSTAFGQRPYFDQPFYVGFNIAGYELGLQPSDADSPAGPGGSMSYWRVPDIGAAVAHFTASGATLHEQVQDVGEGIKVASVRDPFGNTIGLIENPGFTLPAE
jgi:predicted enzyme related to lactoylglutathione lyase